MLNLIALFLGFIVLIRIGIFLVFVVIYFNKKLYMGKVATVTSPDGNKTYTHYRTN